jgi:tRNA (guanine-N1)-methyltransferase
MRFEVITLFPELFEAFASKGLVGKANEAGVIRLRCTNPRDFAQNKHKSVDDAPYGGGSGMVMMPGPLLEAVESVETAGRVHRILLSPQGKPFDQATAQRLSALPAIALVCGRYEGIDDCAAHVHVAQTFSQRSHSAPKTARCSPSSTPRRAPSACLCTSGSCTTQSRIASAT